ncbi:MAG: hypothetical protein ACAH24_29145 [Hyphomicrobiaceae bacterium]|jgi:hypothetical protein
MARQLTPVPASSAAGSTLLLSGVPAVCRTNAASGAASPALTERKAA